MLPLELTPQDLSNQLENQDTAFIDVREPQEFAIARIDGAELIPMNTIPAELQRVEALADEKRLVFFCHHGVRSMQVVNWLRQQGIENCVSMAGGIDRWSLEIDPNVPRY